MRHYYDIYELLLRSEVQAFIGTDEYQQHKNDRLPQADNKNIATNEAFTLSDAEIRALYADAYTRSSSLYYANKPTFEQILAEIGKWKDKM